MTYSLKIAHIENEKDIDEDTIRRTELEIGYKFPDVYKDFFLQYQGVVFLEMNYVVVDFGNGYIDKVVVFSLDNLERALISWHNVKDYPAMRGTLPIGDCLGGHFWGMSLEEGDYGVVYAIEHSLEKTKVADSFVEFIDKIVYIDE